MKTQDDAIICLMANYGLEDVKPFLSSWIKNASAAKLIVLCENLTKDLMIFADRHDVRVYDANLVAYSDHHPQTARYFRYREIIAELSAQLRSILLTDARDVVFQGNPFEVTLGREVSFAVEDKIIAECQYNSNWIKQAYGDSVFQSIKLNPISCSGTTIGSANGMKSYLDLICNEAGSVKGRGKIAGLDQGLHNFILWKIQPSFVELDISRSWVQTVGYTDASHLAWAGESILVDNKFSPLLHQWDRHPKIAEKLKRIYNLNP